MFDPAEKARADLRPGTLYAVAGVGDWIYYGQVTAEKLIGFFRRRDRELARADEILGSPIMAAVGVSYPSIGRALRSGCWKKIGRHLLHPDLRKPREAVQWPIGTLTVTVQSGDQPAYDTRVEDEAIQHMEVIASWDAEHHIPQRLVADFGEEEAEDWVGGPVWRERKLKEILAARFPDAAWHRLPADWVATTDSDSCSSG
jgi:hypothetical protein